MESLEDSEYFRRRAEEERAAAGQADDERAAQTHRALAARYDAKASGSPVREAGKDEPDDGDPDEFSILP